MSITVLTSIVGGKDYLVEEQVKGEAEWRAYLDKPYSSGVWQIEKAYDRLSDPRRNSRAPKLLSHLFSGTEYSIWIDGNISLTKPPEELIERYLQDADMAVFKHPKRDCLYDEATKCAVSGLDDPEVIIEQVTAYERDGFAKHKGLGECNVIFRRHSEKVWRFNEVWWAHYCRFSCRDQISFMYAADSVGIKINMINEPWRIAPDGVSALRGDCIKIVPHTILNPRVV